MGQFKTSKNRAARRAQLTTVFFLSASLLYMPWNLLFTQVSAVWSSLRKTCHFVTLASVRTSSWTLTASHHEWRSGWFSEALLLRKKAGSWFAVSGCDGTLQLIFRKDPLTPCQITRFSAPDNAGRRFSTERMWSKFALPFESSLLVDKLTPQKREPFVLNLMHFPFYGYCFIILAPALIGYLTWGSCLTSVYFSFLIGKVREIIVPIS